MSGAIVVDFENAVKKCGFGKFNFIVIILSGGLMACAFLELSSVSFILPIAECDLDLQSSDKGVLGAIGYFGVILSSFLWGFLSDTRGRRKVLIISLLISFTATAASSLANSFWLLMLLRFVNGFFISCASSTTFAYLGEFHHEGNRARVLMIASIIYAFISLQLPTYAFLTVQQDWSFYIELVDVEFKPWRLFIISCGLPTLICALVLIFILPESPKFTYSQGDEEKTLKILQRMYRMNTGNSLDSFDVKGIIQNDEYNSHKSSEKLGAFRFMWSSTVPLFKGKHLRNILTACFIQFSVCNTANGFYTFLPEILNKISLWSESEASGNPSTVCEIFTMMNLGNNQTEIADTCVSTLETSTFKYFFVNVLSYAFCYTIMSLTINWAGKLVLIVVTLTLSALCALLIIFIKVPVLSSYLYVVMLLAGLVLSIVNASTVELFPTKMRAMAICFSMMVGRIGSFVGSIVIGLVIDKYCSFTFLMPIILLVTSGILAFTIPNIAKRHKN